MVATKSNGIGRGYFYPVRWLRGSFDFHFEGTGNDLLLRWRQSSSNGYLDRYPTKPSWNGQLPPLVWLQRYCLLLGYLHHIPKYGDEVEELLVLVSILWEGSRDLP